MAAHAAGRDSKQSKGLTLLKCHTPQTTDSTPVVCRRYRSPRLRARTLSQTQAAVGVEPPPQLKPASSRDRQEDAVTPDLQDDSAS